MAAPWGRAKLGRPRLAVHIETNLELIAIQAKDAEVPISSFGPCDEFDVDFVRLGFDIDVEDPFVSRFRRFGAKSVSIDEYAGGFQRAGGNGAAVDFQARERPGPFERTKLFDMARQMRPTGESGFSRDR